MGISEFTRPLPTRRRTQPRPAHVAIVLSTRDHVGPIAKAMRQADRVEVGAVDHTPREALLLGLRASTICWTVKIDGKAAAMCGVTPGASLIDGSPIGVPWMLATDAVSRHARAFLIEGRRLIGAMLDRYGQLENCVWAENERAIILLRRLGFAIAQSPIPIGGLPFLHFAVNRSRACV